MVRFVNVTPHAIHMNSGLVYEPSGNIARVAASYTEFDSNGICTQQFGAVTGLPAAEDGVIYIVSSIVLAAVGNTRNDVVAPATGHPNCVRNNGMIVSVPGFVR